MKKRIIYSLALVWSNYLFAGDMGSTENINGGEGVYVGFGASYNSLDLSQNLWEKGIANIQGAGRGSNGVAQGNSAPIYNTVDRLTPEIQVGYLKHFSQSNNLYGFKFSYQYLGAKVSTPNVYVPQLGETTSTITGVTSSLYGWVNFDSAQLKVDNQLNLLAFVGHSVGHSYFYMGAGPSLFNLRSKNYYSIGYADFDGVTINVTGLVNNESPAIWAWGGAAQLGATYFINPQWFIDLSYTYAVTGNYTVNHQQYFSNASDIAGVNYVTSGKIFTKNTLSLTNQSLMVSINKIFDC